MLDIYVPDPDLIVDDGCTVDEKSVLPLLSLDKLDVTAGTNVELGVRLIFSEDILTAIIKIT